MSDYAGLSIRIQEPFAGDCNQRRGPTEATVRARTAEAGAAGAAAAAGAAGEAEEGGASQGLDMSRKIGFFLSSTVL